MATVSQVVSSADSMAPPRHLRTGTAQTSARFNDSAQNFRFSCRGDRAKGRLFPNPWRKPPMHDIAKAAPALFVLLWATGFIGARYAMPWAEPFSFLWVRFALTFLLLLALVPLTGARALPPRTAMHAGIAGILMHGAYLG